MPSALFVEELVPRFDLLEVRSTSPAWGYSPGLHIRVYLGRGVVRHAVDSFSARWARGCFRYERELSAAAWAAERQSRSFICHGHPLLAPLGLICPSCAAA